MKAAIIASLSFGGAVSSGVPCQTDEDCSLNGVCTSHECVCDPGWTTLPFGVNGAMEPGCGYLDLGRAAVTACGPACAFHGGEGGVDLETTSWGGSVNKDPASGKFVMFAAEMAQKCTLGQWTTNSQVVMATSTTPTGPFAREGIAIPPWSHNPEAVLAPDGTWVIYTLGPGFHEKKEVNCSHGVPPAEVEVVGAPSTRPAGDFISVNFTIHTSKSTKGPWTATTMVVDHWNSSWTLQNPGNWNPAPVIDADDGSVRVMAHTDWSGWAGEVILEAPSWKGPYTVNGRDDLIDHCAFCEEDPFMWQDKRGNWHVLYHRMFDAAGPLDPHWGKWIEAPTNTGGAVPSPGWAGGHAFSKDGFAWSEWTRCYNTSIPLNNGSTVEVNRRERPKLLFDASGTPVHLYNGAITDWGTYTVTVPINS